jgi:peptide/nickel transport system permease protein
MTATSLTIKPTSRPLRQRHEVYRVLWHLGHDAVALTGLTIVLLIIGSAIFAPYVAPYPPNETNYNALFQGPARQHLLGTDELGRDMFSRIIFGARVSLQVSIGSILLATPLGIVIGLVAGYAGGWVDNVISRIMDISFAFPALLLALLVVAVLGPDLNNLIIALAVIYMPRFGRVIRGSVLSTKTILYVEAARSCGCSNLRIMIRHILPNVLSPIIVQATVTQATAVLAEASLSFLGLGVQPPRPAWGSMLNAGKIYMEQYPHLTIFPGLAIAITVLGFNFLGDGLRDALDPHLRR